MNTNYPRVAQFMPHYPSMEGSSAYCRGLSKAMGLIQPGCCPIISIRPELGVLGEDEDVIHYPLSTKNPLSIPKELIEALEDNRHELDGVVLHCTYNARAAVLYKHLKRLNIPYIFMPHDPYVAELRHHHAIRKCFFWHIYEKKMLKGAEVVQLLSEDHEESLREMGCETPVAVIPNGCEIETLSMIPAEVTPPGKSERVRIQFVGRMDRNHKGLDLLIEGFAEFLKLDISEGVDLYLTGKDWEDREVLESMVKGLNVSDRVIFTGARQEHSMVIHSEADIVVLVSRFDGFGLCIVEAMLASRPVLVSSRTGIAGHVDKAEGGWIVEPTPLSIKDGLCLAMKERAKWPEMGERNHAYVTKNLTWDQVAVETLNLYQKYF